MKTLTLATTVFALLFLNSCGGEQILLPGETVESYDNSLERWRAQNYQDYSFEFRWQCFCLLSNGWVEVTVENDRVVSVKNLETVQEGEYQRILAKEDYLTINGLFTKIKEAYEKPVDSVIARYDATRGFPVDVTLDYLLNGIDDETGFEIRKVSVK